MGFVSKINFMDIIFYKKGSQMMASMLIDTTIMNSYILHKVHMI
jgi:hypothetical protein